MNLNLTDDEVEALDLMCDAFFFELEEVGEIPEDAFITLAAKVGLARLLPTD